MFSKLRISVIIPCYNEEEILEKTHARVKNVLENCKPKSYEIIYINDGSYDKTLDILEKIAEQDQRIKIISFSRNFGHQPAVSAGINFCKGDIAIIIDADLQDPPELFPELIKKYQQEKSNVVYCVRKERKGESFFKKITARLFYRMINNLSETSFPVDTGDFRLIDRKVIEEFKKFKEKNKYIRGLISWLGFKQVPFYYEREKRAAGETKYPLKKMIRLALTGLTYFTKKPLTFAINFGVISIIIGLLFTLYAFISKFSSQINTFPGWVSIIIIILFFGGFQLLFIGIIGIYLGNLFDEIKERPEYIVDKIIN